MRPFVLGPGSVDPKIVVISALRVILERQAVLWRMPKLQL
jgi:hypothetical protein